MDVAGKYELLDQIGSGGMATVHRARQRGIAGFDRIVAIKQIHQHLLTEPGFVERFVREARIVSALSHSNIVQIYDFGHSEAGHYIAMEHLEGWPMFKIVHAAASAGLAIPIPVVLSLLYELCDALDHVHTRRRHDGTPLDIVHRDISLGNLFVARSGHLKLIDFGIASADGLVSDRDGEVAGKPAYMAPETIRGKPVDARVDVYAIGVVAWELLAAARLFSGKDDRATMREVLHATVVPPSRKRADCPPILDSVVLGAMAKDPRKRTATAAILRDQIEVVMRACEVDVRTSTVKRWLKESGLLTMLLGDETSTSESPTTPDRPVRGPTPVAWQAESVPAERPARSLSWLRIAAVAAAVAVAPIAVAVRTHSASAPIATIVMTSTHATAHMTVEPIAVVVAPPPVVPAPIAAPPAPKRHAPRPQPARITAPPEPERAPAPATAPPPPPIESTPPPPSPPPPPRIAAPGPVTVPPDRVHLIAGHISRVDRRRLDQEAAIAHRLSAILCIDTRGQVTSAKLLRDLPAWLHDTLVRDLLTFQFSPYQVAGTASAACFVRQLAITTD